MCTQEAAAPAWHSSHVWVQVAAPLHMEAEQARGHLGSFVLVGPATVGMKSHPKLIFMPCGRFDLTNSVGMFLHPTVCRGVMHSQNCCVPRLSAVRFGPGDVYFDQTCLILGKYFKRVIIEIGRRLSFCAVQMMDMLIEED